MGVPKKIEIEWLSDHYECETCGSSFADGARVYFDGKVVFEFVPSAYCFGSDTMTDYEVFFKVFELLGVEEASAG